MGLSYKKHKYTTEVVRKIPNQQDVIFELSLYDRYLIFAFVLNIQSLVVEACLDWLSSDSPDYEFQIHVARAYLQKNIPKFDFKRKYN